MSPHAFVLSLILAFTPFQNPETHTATAQNPFVVKRKSFTFFYEPFAASGFDSVLVPLGLEPAVQFSVYLRMQYQVRRSSLN